MPRGLTLSQRLTRPDGLPTWAARLAVVALMLATAAVGYAAGPRDGGSPARAHRAVAASRIAGDLPIAQPVPAPRLRGAAALPALRGGRRTAARRVAAAAAAPTPKPAASATPAPDPEPAAAAPRATAAPPVAAPAPPPPARPAPRSTPAPTFDSSG